MRLKSLSTTVATPRKWPGRQTPSSGCATAGGSTYVEKPGGYMSACCGTKTRSQPRGRERLQIGFQRPRIFAKILLRAELRWIDEDRGDDDVGLLRGRSAPG